MNFELKRDNDFLPTWFAQGSKISRGTSIQAGSVYAVAIIQVHTVTTLFVTVLSICSLFTCFKIFKMSSWVHFLCSIFMNISDRKNNLFTTGSYTHTCTCCWIITYIHDLHNSPVKPGSHPFKHVPFVWKQEFLSMQWSHVLLQSFP